MATTDILLKLLLCGLLGMIGQGIRTIVGLKKLRDEQKNPVDNTSPEAFSTSRLLLSLFTGFVAGSLAFLVKMMNNKGKVEVDSEFILFVIVGGYAGVDFIEGAFKPFASKQAADAGTATPASVPDEAQPQLNQAAG